MIANILHVCGLDLGPEKELLPPAPDNPQGFWENRSFLKLNDAILKELGGEWDRPAGLDAVGWEDEPRFHRFHNQARKLVRRFPGREPWGWKDPRNCLTLPLWNKVVPEMRVLLCVRNPLAVAESLRAREGMSLAASFDLWLTYNRCALSAMPAERRIVTLCESYFIDPHAELQRVLGQCGLAASEQTIEHACVQINPSLVHHRTAVDELSKAGASDELVKCYLNLRELAHPLSAQSSLPSREVASRPRCLAET